MPHEIVPPTLPVEVISFAVYPEGCITILSIITVTEMYFPLSTANQCGIFFFLYSRLFNFVNALSHFVYREIVDGLELPLLGYRSAGG